MARLAGCVMLRRFGSERSGNIAIMFVFMLGLLMLFVGGAVDFTRYNTIRADLVESMDAAGLAMAQIDALNGPEIRDLSGSAREEYLKEQGRKFFYANFKHAALVEDLNVDFDLSASTIIPKATGSVKTLFLGIGQMLQLGSSNNNGSLSKLNLSSETEIVRRDDGNIEVAMVMDLTGSMGGTKIADLRTAAKEMVDIVVRDDQSEWYSKVALVPYSIGVNVGSYATSVRGAVAGPIAITNAVWKVGTAQNITNVEKLNPVKITTSSSHGFSNGDTVWIEGVERSGGSGSCRLECQINSKAYTVSNATSTTFTLQGVNGTSWSGNYSSSSNDFATKCTAASCEVLVTAPSHGFSTNDYVRITDVNGMTQINNTSNSFWRITKVNSNSFTLNSSIGPNYSAYSSGGSVWCTVLGCEYYRVTANDGNIKALRPSTCVSERLGANAYTDVAPSTAKVGWNYPFSTSSGSNSSCTESQIVPLSTNREALKTSIDGYNAVGYTAGHIGVAWGWYMLSPEFGYLWPSESAPGAYDDDELTKVAVIMTDGEFNTQYCKGAVSKDSSGPGNSSRMNCNSENGNGFDQAEDMCDAMKDAGVLIYTIGFDVGSNTNVQDLMKNCATGPDYVYFAATGDELKDIYRAIGSEISKLHISK